MEESKDEPRELTSEELMKRAAKGIETMSLTDPSPQLRPAVPRPQRRPESVIGTARTDITPNVRMDADPRVSKTKEALHSRTFPISRTNVEHLKLPAKWTQEILLILSDKLPMMRLKPSTQ